MHAHASTSNSLSDLALVYSNSSSLITLLLTRRWNQTVNRRSCLIQLGRILVHSALSTTKFSSETTHLFFVVEHFHFRPFVIPCIFWTYILLIFTQNLFHISVYPTRIFFDLSIYRFQFFLLLSSAKILLHFP